MVFKQQLLRQPKNLSLKYLPSKKALILDGPKGTFSYFFNSELKYSSLNKKFWLFPNSAINKSSFFLSQVLLVQSCIGVTLGYRCQLNLVGIGYSASMEKKENGNLLVLKLGFSHLVKITIPNFLFVSCPKPKTILIKGINLQKVNSFAALLKDLKQPNPYKEKGLYYNNEVPKLKQGKKT
jgi:large subunit ribosomal protein L6